VENARSKGKNAVSLNKKKESIKTSSEEKKKKLLKIKFESSVWRS